MSNFNREDFEKMVKAASNSDEHANLLIAVDAFAEACSTADTLLKGMSQSLALCSLNVTNGKEFIKAICEHAISAIEFAEKMQTIMQGVENDTTH
jgi:hypothetical protein